MRFINLKTLCEEGAPETPLVLCLGNFDGVHLGHRQIIKETVRRARQSKVMKSGAWLFESLPSKRHSTIFSTEQKLDRFASLGLDYAILADFYELCDLSAYDFVENVLKRECRCAHAVCGENFRFGANASGDAHDLFSLMNGNATIVPLFKLDGSTISSTAISALLECGDIESANKLLGDSFYISGEVLHGKALGRKLGFPTVNIALFDGFALKNGVYATISHIDGQKYIGVSNVGVRPTVDNAKQKNVETHVIDYSGDCYGKTLKIEFISRLRDEARFDSLDALKERISCDVEAARSCFAQK